MKKFIALGILVLWYSAANCQTSRQIIIKGGNDIRENLMNEAYLYPSFEPGEVVYQSGKKYTSRLNYNRFISMIQFIDEKNDTLALSHEETIHYVLIGNDLFYYDKGYQLQIAGNDAVKLARKETLKMSDRQKIGGYGIPVVGGTVESYDHTNDARILNRFDLNEDVILHMTVTYSFANRDNHFMPAGRKSVLALFPQYEKEIRDYLKDHTTDFKKPDDLRKLTRFITEL